MNSNSRRCLGSPPQSALPKMLAEIALTNRKFTGNPHPRLCGKGEERGKITDVKSRLAFTRPRCLAADLESASVDFATVEAQPVWGGEETFTALVKGLGPTAADPSKLEIRHILVP